MKLRLLAAVATASLLAACGGGSGGGGGVNPVPPPPPAPTPTPTPTPSPTPTNTSLANLQFSETFTSDGASGTGSYPTNGNAGTASAALNAGLTVRYDADSRSYTINPGSRSQSFRPADRDAAASNPQFDVYIRADGNTRDALSLTRPGSSGRLTYTYVGAGFWQRTTQGANSVQASVDAFTYGVVTPDTGVPRTGQGTYAIDLIGSAGLTNYLGEGVFDIDFASGQIRINADVQTIMDGGVVLPTTNRFVGTAALGSTNRFNGNFTFDTFERFAGTLNGRFYGPQAQEVGAAFAGNGSASTAIVGTITGRRDDSRIGGNFTLANLSSDQDFTGPHVDHSYSVDANGRVTAVQGTGNGQITLRYRAADRSFTYADMGGQRITTFAPGNRLASESNARQTVYEITDANNQRVRLTLYNPGSGNDQLALTYTSFGRWQRAAGPTVTAIDNHFVWGVKTNPGAMPRTGTASYSGIVNGIATNAAQGDLWQLGGTSQFQADFSRGAFDGSFNPVGTHATTGQVRDFGRFGFIFASGIQDGVFNATITDNGTNQLGQFRGQFFGPAAQEFGATFNFRWPFSTPSSPPGEGPIQFTGATVAKRP